MVAIEGTHQALALSRRHLLNQVRALTLPASFDIDRLAAAKIRASRASQSVHGGAMLRPTQAAGRARAPSTTL